MMLASRKQSKYQTLEYTLTSAVGAVTWCETSCCRRSQPNLRISRRTKKIGAGLSGSSVGRYTWRWTFFATIRKRVSFVSASRRDARSCYFFIMSLTLLNSTTSGNWSVQKLKLGAATLGYSPCRIIDQRSLFPTWVLAFCFSVASFPSSLFSSLRSLRPLW